MQSTLVLVCKRPVDDWARESKCAPNSSAARHPSSLRKSAAAQSNQYGERIPRVGYTRALQIFEVSPRLLETASRKASKPPSNAMRALVGRPADEAQLLTLAASRVKCEKMQPQR